MPNVADYVARRLEQLGVKVLFGVPAFYCFRLFEAAPRHNIVTVVNSSDLEAGYAADGYARVRGLGAVSVAYGVGTLSLANAIAGAYAEHSPVVILNGGPTSSQIRDLKNLGVLYSHSIGREATDFKVFEQVTELAVRIDSVGQVPTLVDRAITTAITKKRPVYIEIAQDLWTMACAAPTGTLKPAPPVHGQETQLAREILQLIAAAAKPALMLGIELQRFDLADPIVELINKLPSKCVWATTALAKSVIPETVPRFAGVCDLDSQPSYKRLEQADQLIALGCVFPTGYRKLVDSRSTTWWTQPWSSADRRQAAGDCGHSFARRRTQSPRTPCVEKSGRRAGGTWGRKSAFGKGGSQRSHAHPYAIVQRGRARSR